MLWHQKKTARFFFRASLLAFGSLVHAAGFTPTTLTDPLYSSGNSLRYYYGSAVTLSPDGSLAIVAANTGGYQIQPNTPASVYVFQYAGGAWSTSPIITLSDPLANPNCGDHNPTDQFAYGTAVSGITNNGFVLVVGSPAGGALLPSCPTSPSNVTYGVVYIYHCTVSPASCGLPVAVLADPATSPSAGDNFGAALAISPDGNNILVGAPGSTGLYPPGGGTPAPGILGSAYLFAATSGSWPASPNAKVGNPAGACVINGTAPYQMNLCDQFGSAVALSGTAGDLTALVGAPGAAVSSGGSPTPGEGQAFIFSNAAGSWTLETTLADPASPPLGDQFGFAVALSADGTKALIGAPNTAAPLAISGEVGAASLYVQPSGTWQGVTAPAVTLTNPQLSADFPPPPPFNSIYTGSGGFGTSVGLSSDGTTLIVGLPEALEGTNSQDYGGTGQADLYTCSYAAAPVTCAAGTTLVDPPALISVNGVYPSPADFFGASVAISVDGSVLLVGAPDTSSPAGGTTIDSGTAYVYGAPSTVAGQATLSLSLTSAPASLATGGSINYNFTVTDTSATVAAGSLTLTDALPAGVTYKSSSGGVGGTCVTRTTGGATTVTCTLSTLAAKAAWQPTITVIAGSAGTITDNGSVLASGVAATSSNTVSSVIVAPPIANSGSLTTGENTAQSSTLTASDPGSTLTLSYAIVANPAHGKVTITPATGAYTYTPATGYHGTDSFTFDVSNGVATSAPATISITVSASQLTLSYSGPNGVSVTPGQQLTYTATVANIGSVPADNLVLSVSVPSGVTLVSYATPVGTCTGGSAVSCTLATLNNAPWVLTVVVSVNAADSAGAAIASSASLSLSNGASPAPVSASVTVAAAAGGGGGGGGGASGGGGLGWLELLGLAGLAWFGRRRRAS
jgi:uncharacterized repeat protein (TIGR01451 family)